MMKPITTQRLKREEAIAGYNVSGLCISSIDSI